jgi:Peptidase family M28/PDZ domain
MLSLLLLATPLQAAIPAQAPPSALRIQDIKAHISFLASEELEGRGSGSKGGFLASQYIAAHWKRLGLLPANEGSYFHYFQVRDGSGEMVDARNTCAILPGTDPALADQYLVIGGHHDHAGLGDRMMGGMGFPGEVHNGADDNASGATGVMELAEYYAAHPLRHPILFITFSAEERGLLGSAAIVKDKVVDPEKMIAMVNLDMIGRMTDRYLFIGGMGTSEEMHGLLDPVFARAEGFDFEFHDGGEAPSDNTNFYRAGVPAIFFFTHVHEDYHMPTDDADKIHYPEEIQILKLVRDCVNTFDGLNGSMTYVKQSRREASGMPADFGQRMGEHMRRYAERRARRGKFGVKIGDPADGGVAVASVSEDSAAELAGLVVGDVLIKVDKRRIHNRDDVRRALAGKEKGTEIKVVILRDGEQKVIQATLK